MSERDPMRDLLQEWKSPEPGGDFDERVRTAYRAEFPLAARPKPLWMRIWSIRVSIPVPVLLAGGAAIVAIFLWLRPAPAPVAAPVASPNPAAIPSGVLTQLNVTGFQPLPNGEARVVDVSRSGIK